MGPTVLLEPEEKFQFDGELLTVVIVEATRVTLRDAQGRWKIVSLAEFLCSARAARQPEEELVPSPGLRLAALTAAARKTVSERAAHIRELLTGYRSGSATDKQPGEPRPQYDPARPLMERHAAKARELGVGERTLRRWASDYENAAEAGLVDSRMIRGKHTAVDPRWDQALGTVTRRNVNDSTLTRGAVLRQVTKHLDEQYGEGAVPRPPRATAYRRLKELTKGTNAVQGSAKGRRSIADRPPPPYGRLRATRPGEYAILDTQDLDVFAMEPVTCRWVRVQLTVVLDLWDRGVTGLRLTPVSTKAVDVAGVLHQAMLPQAAPRSWPKEADWAYRGIPRHLVLTENQPEPLAGVPLCAPETIIVDHGKAFLSAHVISVCTRLGISIQPARPKVPTDKPTVERFFKTLREGLIQYLPAYKGPDIYSRGDHVEDGAFYFIHELEEIIREWVALVYHRTRHAGLVIPEWPRLGLSPNEMYEAGVEKAGFLRVPASPDLVYDFLEVAPRTIQHYGVEVNGLRYTGDAIKDHVNETSPYGGALNGKWPIRVNPDDIRCVYFQEQEGGPWHRLDWEHAPMIGTPFSAEAARYARRLAATESRHPDSEKALSQLLARWDKGMVTDRRERRMAARLAAERAALPLPDPGRPDLAVAALPSLAGHLNAGDDEDQALLPEPVPPDPADEDDEDEIFDHPDDEEEFYDDAFGVIE
jgi:transposase InsO family protein